MAIPDAGDGLKTDTATKANSVFQEEVQKRTAVFKRLRYAIVNAIPHEYAATNVIFGEPEIMPALSLNKYRKISYVTLKDQVGEEFHVALAGTSGQGIAQAAAATAQIISKCPYLEKVILIGIAAGQPNLSDKEKDVRLGDVVVGDKLIQYDHVKRTDGNVEVRGDNIPPGDRELLSTIDILRSLQDHKGSGVSEKPWDDYISTGAGRIRSAARPSADKDPHTSIRDYKKGFVYERPDDRPFVHVGTIGSANTLLKDGRYRDSLGKKHGMLAYEMEGAGVAIAAAAAGIGYLNIRGICDYADSNKNDDWQTYASVCAAAVARAILERL